MNPILNFPKRINNLIHTGYKRFFKIIDYYYTEFKNKFSYYKDFKKSINKLEFVYTCPNEKKKQLIKDNTDVIDWLKSTSYFDDIYKETKYSNFIPRENQIKAFNRLENKGLETGIHCQATGCGKSAIIIRYCDYVYKHFKNSKIIIFTERVNIIADLFSLLLQDNNEKLKMWKDSGIGDLTNYYIMDCVTKKDKDWNKKFIESTKDTILLINRSFLTSKCKYKNIKKNNLHLVLHDECHNTSSEKCYNFLTYIKSLNVPIVGFSATPVKSNENDRQRLSDIYGINFLTNYNIIYSIKKKLILPPEFHLFEIESYNNDEDDDTNKWSENELLSFFKSLDNIVTKLPNKKLVAWCGSIDNTKKLKDEFEIRYKKYKNLKNFTFGIDISGKDNNEMDYKNFKKSKGNSILFCACKHREGSDIDLLDGCIFLDKVKNRGIIPFIQSIGRVLRIGLNKNKGIIIDSYINDNLIKKIKNYQNAFGKLTNTESNEYIYDKKNKCISVIIDSYKINIFYYNSLFY
jgi:superfamily II DNA or RNA helicase